MKELYLHLIAPHAVFRPLACKQFRPTYCYPTYSAMSGFVLCLAGYELDDKWPDFELAIGIVKQGKKNALLNQSHKFLIGTGNKKEDEQEDNEENIDEPNLIGEDNENETLETENIAEEKQPVPVKIKRKKVSLTTKEFLSEVEYFLAIKGPEDFILKVKDSILGKSSHFILPFLGDSNFFLEELNLISEKPTAKWLVRFSPQIIKKQYLRPEINNTFLLDIEIDRKKTENLKRGLFTLTKNMILPEGESDIWINRKNASLLTDQAPPVVESVSGSKRSKSSKSKEKKPRAKKLGA